MKGKKITQPQREDIKGHIRHCNIMRYTLEETLEHLEDKGFEIQKSTYYNIKEEMREDMKKRFTDIGKYELGEENLMNIESMKKLLQSLWKDFNLCDDPIDRSRISAEIRATTKDLKEFYNDTEVIESVIKYFEEVYERKEKDKIEQVGKKNV